MSDSINLVLVGLGLIGKRHADIIEKTEDAKLLAIVDSSEEAHNYAVEKSLPIYGSLEDMFLEQSPDGIILATPTPMHSKQGLICIHKKCPVMIEKPIANSSQEACDLVEKAEN